MTCPHAYENPDLCPGCRAESEAMRLRAENDRFRAVLAEIAQAALDGRTGATVDLIRGLALKALEGA